jgi:GT2 family glycosyltransferase
MQSHTKVIKEGSLHGVTRAYNRGFRLATKPYLTWFSDDFIYDIDALDVLLKRFSETDSKTLLSLSIDVKDGDGFKNYAPNTPIGAGHTKLFQSVDYWSEDFITYASDNDFSQKVIMSGGKVIAELGAKVIHNIDLKDDLHNENLSYNPCSLRYRELYKSGIKSFNKTYPDIWINARNADELYSKIQNARSKIGWCNFYTSNLFNHERLFKSMNISIGSRDKYYAKEI